ARAEGVVGVGVAGARGDVLDGDVGCLDDDRAANQSDARIGGGLARNHQMRMPDGDRFSVEIDDASHLEHDDARTRIVERPAEGAVAVGVEGGDSQDGSRQSLIRSNWLYQSRHIGLLREGRARQLSGAKTPEKWECE